MPTKRPRFLLHVIVLFLLCISHLNGHCIRRKQKKISPSACVAGRRFFARFDQIPAIAKLFTNKPLLQPYVYPWIAKIMAFYAGKPIICTGTLINDRYILTSQQCVAPPLRPEHITVSLGYDDSGVPYQSLQSQSPNYVESEILQIILHPDYNASDIQTASNDLALLKIRPVTYTKTIYPIQLPTVADKYYDLTNKTAESVGWQHPFYSTSNQRYPLSNTFHKKILQVLSNDKCRSFSPYYQYAIKPGVLCSIDVGTDNDGPCFGGNGTPLMIENHNRIFNITILIGILSWSAPETKPCIWNGTPVVFVRIDNKLSWILDNTKDASYCRY